MGIDPKGQYGESTHMNNIYDKSNLDDTSLEVGRELQKLKQDVLCKNNPSLPFCKDPNKSNGSGSKMEKADNPVPVNQELHGNFSQKYNQIKQWQKDSPLYNYEPPLKHYIKDITPSKNEIKSTYKENAMYGFLLGLSYVSLTYGTIALEATY